MNKFSILCAAIHGIVSQSSTFGLWSTLSQEQQASTRTIAAFVLSQLEGINRNAPCNDKAFATTVKAQFKLDDDTALQVARAGMHLMDLMSGN